MSVLSSSLQYRVYKSSFSVEKMSLLNSYYHFDTFWGQNLCSKNKCSKVFTKYKHTVSVRMTHDTLYNSNYFTISKTFATNFYNCKICIRNLLLHFLFHRLIKIDRKCCQFLPFTVSTSQKTGFDIRHCSTHENLWIQTIINSLSLYSSSSFPSLQYISVTLSSVRFNLTSFLVF